MARLQLFHIPLLAVGSILQEGSKMRFVESCLVRISTKTRPIS